ncbi:LPS-assembly lipoprotein LptE [Psychrobacter alimentarius]|uniref:LPS-assembly lipoprotein LptE n=1 Tax=Psychrobacter alimentarius TaxID=261164 RepID=UPI003FD342CA
MWYKQRAGQSPHIKLSAPAHLAKSSSKQKLAAALLAALPMFGIVGATAGLSGCGFQLRGYDSPMLFDAAKTAVIIEDNRISFPLKLPLTHRLETLGVEVIDNMTVSDVMANNKNVNADPIAAINISNVRFKRYELVGVLTEIRLVLSANVTYQTTENGKPVTLTNPIQVERSYQYNEASVSTDDLQGDQIRDWLYDSLARRITDQYVAISLPKVTSNGTSKPIPVSNNVGSTTVVVPTP